MKALIRDTEIITEPFPAWVQGHLLWMQTARPDGDGYAFCEDCPVPDPEPQDFDISAIEVPDASAPADEDGTATVPTIVRRIAIFNQERYTARKQQEATE